MSGRVGLHPSLYLFSHRFKPLNCIPYMICPDNRLNPFKCRILDKPI